MSKLFNSKHLKNAGTRALRTALQTFIGCTVASTTLGDVNWAVVGSTVALATVVSFAQGILSTLPEDKQ